MRLLRPYCCNCRRIAAIAAVLRQLPPYCCNCRRIAAIAAALLQLRPQYRGPAPDRRVSLSDSKRARRILASCGDGDDAHQPAPLRACGAARRRRPSESGKRPSLARIWDRAARRGPAGRPSQAADPDSRTGSGGKISAIIFRVFIPLSRKILAAIAPPLRRGGCRLHCPHYYIFL